MDDSDIVVEPISQIDVIRVLHEIMSLEGVLKVKGLHRKFKNELFIMLR